MPCSISRSKCHPQGRFALPESLIQNSAPYATDEHYMNLHEYQSKRVFAQYAIPTPKGEVADSPEGAVAAAQKLGGSVWVVKAQVHAGGRGKAGGVVVAKDLDAVRAAAAAMLGKVLVTHQTGPEGLPVRQIYVEQ